MSSDNYDLAALRLIPYLFSPVNIVLKNKKVIRPSKIKQSNAFIVNIPVNIHNSFLQNTL